MVNEHEPTRWLDDASDAPFELKNVLASAVNDGGGADAVAKLAAKLPSALGVAGGLSGGATTVGTSASAGVTGAAAAKSAVAGWKIAIWVAGVTVATGASVNLIPMVGGMNRGGEEPAAVIAPAAVELSGTSKLEAAAPVETVRAQEELGREEAKEPEKKPLAHGKGTLKVDKVLPLATAGTAATVVSDGKKEDRADSLSKEAKLLLQVKADVAKDPEKALKLAEKHHRMFGDGALLEEREVLQIEALVRLGRVEEAKAAASRFRAEHPQSGHLARVARLVAK
ncbi:MAG: hypothetical protein IPK82_22880 [Polyangiaceae bacterium]|nr:hypothetical protein [Polyangiaceae bacterium]